MTLKILSLYFLVMFSNQLFASSPQLDTLSIASNNSFNPAQLVVPATLIAYGFLGLPSGFVQDFNLSLNSRVVEQGIVNTYIDDYLRFVPMVSVYALNAFGVQGKNRFMDRSILLTSSFIVMAGSVQTLKYTLDVKRPDVDDMNSFPSGHTATAFMAAEFLWQEYADVSLWYGVSGYVVATSVGAVRILRNKHWLTDVAAGAGFGILSTKIVYWAYPHIRNYVITKYCNQKHQTLMAPYYNGNQYGMSMLMIF